VDNIFANLHYGLDKRGLSYAYLASACFNRASLVTVYLPESPAIKTFSLPRFFPFSVNGLLLGIEILGMTS
jgi:hypothetical protein